LDYPIIAGSINYAPRYRACLRRICTGARIGAAVPLKKAGRARQVRWTIQTAFACSIAFLLAAVSIGSIKRFT